MKRAYVLIVLVAFTVTVMVSGIYAQPEECISFSTATTSGVWYIIGAGLGEVAKKYGGLNVEVQTSGGSSENFNLLTQKEIDIGMVGCDAFVKLVLDNKRDVSMLRLIMFGSGSARQVIVWKDSGLKTIKDLVGKKVSIGGPGSGAALMTADMLEVGWGLTEKNYHPAYLSYGEVPSALKDRVIDAGLVALAVPAATVIDLSTSVPIGIIEWDKKGIEKIQAVPKYQFYLPVTIPAGTYRGMDEDVTVLSSPPNFILCRADLSEDVVYRFVKAIWEHNEDVVAVHPAGKEYTIENTIKVLESAQGREALRYVSLHPGTIRYLEERTK